ncbi:hypothetical protein AB0G03_22035 [Micromonospora aurantiaca]|uniref:hypothetical protein n=1 Tax=Micromonospora aurantiaca (nom. illeg.) TaxID=47850 RepID=UPI0033CA60ED
MFLTDPVLRRIAADTNDVLPEQQWRHDTATAEPIGDLARLLHKTALDFTDSTTNFDQALTRLGALAETGRRGLAAHAGLYLPGHHQVVTDALAARERHTVLGVTLTACYRAWRNHRPMNEGDERHVLLRRCDPSRGVATLQRKDPDTWLVIPDAEAAAAFDIPYPQRIVGEVTHTERGWAPTAYVSRAHQVPLATVYSLPIRGELTSACRTLLRWWNLRHSDAWHNRTPAQLTPAELAHLTD